MFPHKLDTIEKLTTVLDSILIAKWSWIGKLYQKDTYLEKSLGFPELDEHVTNMFLVRTLEALTVGLWDLVSFGRRIFFARFSAYPVLLLLSHTGALTGKDDKLGQSSDLLWEETPHVSYLFMFSHFKLTWCQEWTAVVLGIYILVDSDEMSQWMFPEIRIVAWIRKVIVK